MELSRRGFIGGFAAASAPFFIGGCKFGTVPPRRISPNSKVNVAIIGCDAHHTKDVADPEALLAGAEFAAKYGLRVLETIELRDPKK